MANFTAGTSFTDGVTNDVTAAKLNALIADAVPTANLSLNSTTGTISNFTASTANITLGTIPTLTAGTTTSTAATITSATITTGTIPTLVATTSITSGTGSASAPAISPTGDTNTGLFFPAADRIAFSVGGVEAARIDANQNIGIGTTSPASKLSVSGDIQVLSTNYLNFTNTAQQTYIRAPLSSTLAFGTDSTERLRIDSSGNVGIGTTSPAQKLEVAGSAPAIKISATSNSAAQLLFNSNLSGTQKDTGSIIYGNDENLTFKTASAERLRIDSSGNVGIGTGVNALSEKLTFYNATNGDGIAWGPSNGHYSQIWAPYSASGMVIGCGIKGSKTADSYLSSYGGAAMYRNAIRLEAFGSEGIRFFTDASSTVATNAAFTPTERLRIDSSGNVGIGVTSPSGKLDIGQPADTFGSSSPFVNSKYNNTSHFKMFMDGDWNTHISSIPVSGQQSGLAFDTNNTERLRINSSGNCSIGTATALSRFHVHGDITLSNTTTATTATTGGVSVPGTAAGFLTVSINGTSRKIPYYA